VKNAGQGCLAPVEKSTGAWRLICHERESIRTPATRNPNAARRDAGRRDKITFAEAEVRASSLLLAEAKKS